MTRIGSICSGYAGLDRAVREVLGGDLAFVADNDPGASALLAHHFPDVPNLGDIKAVDWFSVGAVDLLCGGFPCQDVSAAGARAGLKHGNRSGLWHEFATAISVLRPGMVVIENVLGLLTARGDEPTPEHLAAEASRDMLTRLSWWPENEVAVADRKGDKRRARVCRARVARLRKLRKQADDRCQWHEQRLIRAIGTVLGSLAALDYDAEWVVVTASAAGACHRRARLFILAFPAQGRAVAGLPVAVIRDGAWMAPDESLFGMLPFTGRVPASGSMAGGRVYAAEPGPAQMDAALLPTPTTDRATYRGGGRSDELLLPKLAIELGNTPLLKTPTAQLAINGGSQHPDKRRAGGHGPTLADQVEHLLPTPNATDGKGGNIPLGRMKEGRPRTIADADLPAAVALLPTPRATDGTKGGPNQRGSSGDLMLPSAVMGLLPIPTANVSGRTPEQHMAMRESIGRTTPSQLEAAARLLPTPSVADGAGGHKTRSGDRKGEPLLGGIAMLLPTPTAMDSHGARNATANRKSVGPATNNDGWTLTDVFWTGDGPDTAARRVDPCAGGWGPYEAAIRRWEAVTGRPAPRPTVPGKTGERLNPALPEFMMGLPEGWITAVPGLSRNAMLKLAGNGVVPQQCVLALRILLERAGLTTLGRAA